jgi:transcription antitermination protein NusB
MANRHLARSVVLQVLFERDSLGGKMSKEDTDSRTFDYAKEFGARESDMPFMKELIQTVIAKEKEIDEVIRGAAPEWPIEKIAAVDRNILRLGLAELLYADKTHVPEKVAINEAIELAKTFGGASSSRFVNGVLGAVYVELGEPGKTDGKARKKGGPLFGGMSVEELIGAVVYARDSGVIYLALVHDIFGHWTLSKGKLLPGESHENGLKRKVMDEIGLEVQVEDQLGENEYIANDSTGGGNRKKRRHAMYFLARAQFKDLLMKKEGGLDDAQWFPLASVGDLNFYDDILPVVTRAINLLAQKDRT